MSEPVITPAGYLNRHDLQARGWTVSIIRKLLPKADAVQEKIRGIYRLQINLYKIARVEAAESTQEFSDMRAAAVHRAAAPARRDEGFELRYRGDWRAALPDACHGLHSLNRYAKHRDCAAETRYAIYDLKNRTVELLYRHGYSTAAFIHVQRLPAKVCRDCGGKPTAYWCDHCGGTGEYLPAKDLQFYVFRFLVGGRFYTWHQPDSLVKFPVEMTAAPSEWAGVLDREKPLEVPKRRFTEVRALLKWVIAYAAGTPETPADHLPVDRPLETLIGEQEALFEP